jgi:hypothetical protein
VTLKVEKLNSESACTIPICKGRFVDLLADHKTASVIAQVLMEAVCNKTDAEKMRKYMHMTVKEDGQCASSKQSKFKAIRVMSPFGLCKRKVEEATTMSNVRSSLSPLLVLWTLIGCRRVAACILPDANGRTMRYCWRLH